MTILFHADNEPVCTVKGEKSVLISESVVVGGVTDDNIENNDNDNVNDTAETKNDTIDDNERRQMCINREEQESIELARQLMAEEAIFSYHQHVRYLHESANELSNEDYVALERAIREEHDDVQQPNRNNEYHEGSDNDNDDDDDEEEEEDDNGDDDSELSYEAMLTLGERIGDVKTERWKMIAAKEIQKLPLFQYQSNSEYQQTDDCENCDDSELKCLICQTDYENKEILLRLPCNHCFHKDCVTQWLLKKDVCPYCRNSIVDA